MTQDYEPIEITESTPEPADGSFYFLTDRHNDYSTVGIVNEYGWVLPGLGCNVEWEQVRDRYIGWRIQSLAAHDAQIRAEAVLSAFHYDDYEGEDDQDPRLRLGDYVYAFIELPPNMEEVGFHAHIVNFSDDYMGVKPTPAFKILDSEGEERYASILECAMQGYSFILVNKQSVAKYRKEQKQ